MTPYAVLLVRPTDDDLTIRKAFHRLAELHHPDKNNGASSQDWIAAVEAYSLVKTAQLRADLERRGAALSSVCKECGGFGVKSSSLLGRSGAVKSCIACHGEGRIRC